MRAAVRLADESRSLQSIISDVCAHIGIPVTSPFPLTSTSLPVPAAAQHSRSMMLAPPCFLVGDICSIRPESFISRGLRVFHVPFGKLQAGCLCLHVVTSHSPTQ